MRAHIWLKGGLALVLVAGIALKIALAAKMEDARDAPLVPALTAFLERQGLSVNGVRTSLDLTLIEARGAPDCAMTLAVVAPQGWHADVVRRLERQGDTLFYVFNGALYDDQPVLTTRAWVYGQLLLRHLGVATRARPVLGVIAAPACRARALPWGEVAAIPAGG